jgi:predicted GNAT family acetyltransferase
MEEEYSAQQYFDLPDAHTLDDVSNNVNYILKGYGSRKMAAIQVESYLNELYRQQNTKPLVIQYFDKNDIKSSSDLVAHCKNKQAQLRKGKGTERRIALAQIADEKGNKFIDEITAMAMEQEAEWQKRIAESEKHADGGKIDENSTIIYHEEKGNWFVPKDTFYVWVYNDEKAAQKLKDETYEYVFFPHARMGEAFSQNYVPPLLRVWRKSFQNRIKGADKLIGILHGWKVDDKLFIEMMSVHPKMRRQGINSHMVKTAREYFDIPKENIKFNEPTKEGKMFEKSGKYEEGGNVSTLEHAYSIGDVLTDTREAQQRYKDFGNTPKYYVVVKPTISTINHASGETTEYASYWINAYLGAIGGNALGSYKVAASDVQQVQLTQHDIDRLISNYEKYMEISRSIGMIHGGYETREVLLALYLKYQPEKIQGKQFTYTDANLEGRHATKLVRAAGENGYGDCVVRTSDRKLLITMPETPNDVKQFMNIVEFAIGTKDLQPIN